MQYSQFVIIVGNYGNPYRLISFLSSLARTKGIEYTTVIVVNTKESNKFLNEVVNSYRNHFEIVKYDIGINEPVQPSRQMLHRLSALKDHCQSDPIVCNFDDDYCFNIDWLITANNIFKIDEINYASLLKPYTSCYFPIKNINGKEFLMTDTCMGGSFMVRWSHFQQHMNLFYEKYRHDNDYDNLFWNIPAEVYQKKYFIYMLNTRSMYQHCNFGSQYNREGHMYGDNFSL